MFKRVWVTAGIILLSSSFSYSAQRIIVAEEFTATWCTYCPGAARGLDELYERVYDSVVVIAYHSSTSDPFYTSESAQRASYYNLSGYPTTWFDGILSEVGGVHTGTMFPFYLRDFNQRKIIPSDLNITVTSNYDSVSNTGTVTAVIQNTSSSNITGTLHFVIVENNIPYNWQGMTELDFVVRDMLPNANGESVTIPANDTIIRSRNYTINSSWKEKDCHIVVFVQASNKEIYQGGETGVIPGPEPLWYNYTLNETSGNNNGFAEPGESVELKVLAKNMGTGDYSGGGTISTGDTYVTITAQTPYSVTVAPGDIDTILSFTFDISSNCPNDHIAEFEITAGGIIDTIPFMITTNPGFSDDMESGVNGWTHSGINDNWHQTTHRYNSATHSWYSGVEGNWQYTNENVTRLVSPYFVTTPGENLYYYTYYSIEQDWDYGHLEVNNGSHFWWILDTYTGNQTSWIQKVYPMDNFHGKTTRVCFRFISDASVVQEGWYVDDVYVPFYVSASEKNLSETKLIFNVHPRIFREKASISFSGIRDKDATLKIFNSAGQIVNVYKLNSSGKILWNGEDLYGKKLPSGVYFIKIEAKGVKKNTNVILLR